MTDQFKKIHPGAMSGMTGPLGGRGSKASPPRKRTRPQKERRKKPRKKDKTAKPKNDMKTKKLHTVSMKRISEAEKKVNKKLTTRSEPDSQGEAVVRTGKTGAITEGKTMVTNQLSFKGGTGIEVAKLSKQLRNPENSPRKLQQRRDAITARKEIKKLREKRNKAIAARIKKQEEKDKN
jgi:hypothetical protein